MANIKPRVAITVDVEAHPIRASQDYVNRLIWGRQHGREAGIGTMMDIADKYGVPITFFLDYPEYELYGEELLDVGREIHRRGHDLEPHCHAEYTIKPLFGLEDEWCIRLPVATLEQSRKIVGYWQKKHETITGAMPTVYRSGAYLIGPNYLDALKEAGIKLDASYNLPCPENPFQLGLRGNFCWSNGLREIPIPLVPYFEKSSHLVAWNFNRKCFLRGTLEENIQRHLDFLHSWFKRHGNDNVATLVMHSWSFWQMDENGHINIPLESGSELFDALLETLKNEFEIVSLSAIAKNENWQTTMQNVDPREQTGHCPVCFEAVSGFRDYNGGARRQCPFCHSVERHRTLVDLVYAGKLGPDVFRNKDILHIAPGWPESLLLRRMAGARVTRINILPGCGAQADIQSMPQFADNSFDIVLACEVFRHVRDLKAALSEIRRVLRPGGRLLCSDCLENGDYGREITDHDEQISWYGQEKFDKYGIGDFRRFGRLDWPKAFESFFDVEVFEADDKATGSPAWWLAACPKKEGEAACGA